MYYKNRPSQSKAVILQEEVCLKDERSRNIMHNQETKMCISNNHFYGQTIKGTLRNLL
jgi:hypothetical protein